MVRPQRIMLYANNFDCEPVIEPIAQVTIPGVRITGDKMSDDRIYGFLVLDGPDYFIFQLPENEALEHARLVARMIDNKFTSLEQARVAVWNSLSDDMKEGYYLHNDRKSLLAKVAWLATSSEEWEENEDAVAFLLVIRPEPNSNRHGPDIGEIPEDCLEGNPNIRQFAVISYDNLDAIERLAELYGPALEEMNRNEVARREAARKNSGAEPIFETRWLRNAAPAPNWEAMGKKFDAQVHFTGATNDPKIAGEVNEVLARYGYDVVAFYYYHPLPIMFSLELQFADESVAQAARDMWVTFDRDIAEDDEDERSSETSKAT